MKKTSRPIVFFGNERLATGVSTTVPTLQALIKAGYQVAAVVTNYKPAKSRTERPLEIVEIAKKHQIPVLSPDKLKEIEKELEATEAICGVLAAYGKIVPEEIINIFPKGIVNIHPSLLPLHRGSTPIESAILAGDTKTGVSIMKLAKEMDAGPVYGQSELELDGSETKQQLTDKLLDIGSAMIVELLPGILSDEVAALPQDESAATYDKLITKQDGFIDCNLPASFVERAIRAYSGWPGAKAEIGKKEITIVEAKVVEANGIPGEVLVVDKQLVVCCGEKAIAITRLKPAGKREMSAREFLAGNPV